MDLSTVISRSKRRTGYGNIAVTNDQATLDVLAFFNERLQEAWVRKNWHFSFNEREITTVASTSDYTLEASDGYASQIRPQNGGKPLKRYAYEDYYEWRRAEQDTSEDTTPVVGYINYGRSSADKLIVRIVGTPQTAGDVYIAHCKKRITEYVVGDIATNTLIQYFPAELHRILVMGVVADIYEIQGKKELSAAWDTKFKNALDQAYSEEMSQPDRVLNTPLPRMYRNRRRARGGTTVA